MARDARPASIRQRNGGRSGLFLAGADGRRSRSVRRRIWSLLAALGEGWTVGCGLCSARAGNININGTGKGLLARVVGATRDDV